GGVPPLELLLLPRLLRRLARPALLVVEPALDRRRAGLDALVRQLGLDDPPRLLGLRRRGGVDEELVPVARDREAPALELPGEALRLFAAEVEAEATEQRLHIVLFGQLDSDAPVVAHVVGAASPTSARGRPNIHSDLPVWSRNLVIPPSQKGQPAPSRSAVSTSAASATTPSWSRWRISSATASSAASRISSFVFGSCSWTAISSLPSA